MEDVTQVEQAEDRLLRAQLDRDVQELEQLLHADLVWTAPDGSTGGRDADLQAHREGAFSIRRIDLVRRDVEVIAPGVAVARVVVDVDGDPIAGTIAYTRVWQYAAGRWQVCAAHMSMAG